ncbi:nucleotide-diphospho-sugar transferase [Cytophagaceae bacterium YF14B1]|uniref:Nucleotide-diphospho-sugar transferase n=1 Tax=Xanthocytophaga flava TaxID=3048013 RepID=A0AAE3QS24_9BACT|nr:nucleotide-diphospho-sugar transferase [Xanthocytophaga flavus]MDJ1482171.1 nucleotide-diphospho-sugar transferase [Xanthocytophaga flavus]
MFNTPILFLVFNRPDLAQQVFECIRQIKPKELYIAADGPRENRDDDVLKCAQTREIIKQVDWECEVHTLFREKNLGCKKAVSSAINWFFENVEAGIILEDDTLPDLSFFTFCEKMLNRYRDDERVMMISGYNTSEKWKAELQSYHFSYFGGIWGWASWRRAWQYYDVNISSWGEPENKQLLKEAYFSPEQFKSREAMYNDLYNGVIDTWDLQWTYCRLMNSGLSIIPSINLVKNIGFRSDGTHTTGVPPIWATYSSYSLLNNIHIKNTILVDKEYDRNHLNLSTPKSDSLMDNRSLKKNRSLLKKLIVSIIKKIAN